MTKKLDRALRRSNKQKEDKVIMLSGQLGIPLGGQKLVEVPNRQGFVFVRLKNNTSELIQAYNNAVSPIYDLPVLLARQTNGYRVIGRNIDRYTNQWGQAPYLPKHGAQHSFNPDLNIGGDVVWVYSQQFMPLLGYPSGSAGSPRLAISPYLIRDTNGTWKYVGGTGTPSTTPYNPSSGSRMGLFYIDTVSGNPYLIINSGTYTSETLTGTAQIASAIPQLNNPNYIPIAAVRLLSGTSYLTWDNVYDARPFFQSVPTGTSGGGGSGGIISGTITTDDLTPYISGSRTNFPLTLTPASDVRLYYNGVRQRFGFNYAVTGSIVYTLFTPTTGSVLIADYNEVGGVPVGNSPGLLGVMTWDEGVPLGTGTVLNFVGDNISATISGSVVRVFVTGSTGGGGINTGTLDARYLKLNTSNDPLTNTLHIRPTSNPGLDILTQNYGMVVDAQTQGGDIYSNLGYHVIGLNQRGDDSSGPNEGALEINRLTTGTNVSYSQSAINITDVINPATFRGGTLHHTFISGSVSMPMVEINPYANPGTGTAFLLASQTPMSVSGTYLLFKRQEQEILRVDGSGTVFSKGTALVKEAPANGNVYGRMNNGWVIVSGSFSGGVGGGGGAGIMGWDEGIPLGTGTVLNVVGSGATLSISGTVLNLNVSAGGGISSYTGAAGSEPAANAGDIFFSLSDDRVLERYNGLSWNQWGLTQLIYNASTPSWSWVNQGSGSFVASITSMSNGMQYMSASGSVVSYHLRTVPAPSTPYTVDATFLYNTGANVGNCQFGLFFRDSTSGKFTGISLLANSNMEIQKWTNPTSFNSNYASVTNVLYRFQGSIYLRLRDDGTNRIYSYSMDGMNYIPVTTIGRTDFLTANELSWGIDTDAGGNTVGVTLVSWRVY